MGGRGLFFWVKMNGSVCFGRLPQVILILLSHPGFRIKRNAPPKPQPPRVFGLFFSTQNTPRSRETMCLYLKIWT
ncbi:MAG: hypothetical protein D6714_00140 [Bacteroidetes bacterium]|nr:MAG: hypothetical protein D6714_00140 [Bacteroidota bacterium]